MAATIVDLGARVLRRLGVVVVAASDRPEPAGPVTAAAIATRALQWLGVIAANEAPDPLDHSEAEQKVTSVHEALNAQGLVSWPVTAIPHSVVEDYTMLVAMHLAPVFGKAIDPAGREVIEARLRKTILLARAPAIAEQAVMDAHATLDARGKARWSVFDIPDWAAAAYVVMAANIAAPAFGMPQDPNADAKALRDLTQAIALATGGERVWAEYF